MAGCLSREREVLGHPQGRRRWAEGHTGEGGTHAGRLRHGPTSSHVPPREPWRIWRAYPSMRPHTARKGPRPAASIRCNPRPPPPPDPRVGLVPPARFRVDSPMSSAQKFKTLRGFRDFPPEDLALRSHLFERWRETARRYGFQEYDGPPLEGLELYTEKSGDEIVGQLYAFRDKGDRDVALRPEMTPSLARILADRSRALPKPIRWFSVPQLFRYERQQRGRLREHYQWNVDLVGEDSVDADAEVLAVALDSLRSLGLGADQVRARVSDRRLLAALLRSAGVADDRLVTAYTIIDKVEREPRERVAARLVEEAGVTPEVADRIVGIFDATGLDAVRESFGDDPEVAEALDRVRDFLGVMDDLGFGGFVEFDLAIVRGLAYYTGIVFEIFDRVGEFRAICGGGRYDRLLELVGGDPLPAVGFGMGDVVLSELLKDRGLAPTFSREVDWYVGAVTPAERPLARQLAGALRASGDSVVTPLRDQSVRRQLKSAASEGARRVMLVGPDEVARGIVQVRDMADGSETEVEIRSLLGDRAPGDAPGVVAAAGGSPA
ncbi:MAG: histidine--tRNA ligase [Gemmatimonadales bacterium]|nr:MAG: histidine--tRNA ligase [Gemmatimonadales bacterium]